MASCTSDLVCLLLSHGAKPTQETPKAGCHSYIDGVRSRRIYIVFEALRGLSLGNAFSTNIVSARDRCRQPFAPLYF